MSVYKVIQDVEAEDKLLGPLTLKGFIYAGIAGFCAFISFKLLFISTPLKWLFLPLFFLPTLLFGVLASPIGREQPTEVWLMSRIKFFLKPRSRVWDQMGNQQLVNITAPKKPEVSLTKDLTPGEVQSRLETLASTLDTRGWAVKNVDVNLGSEPHPLDNAGGSDRLISPTITAQPGTSADVNAADDILDEDNNPTAHKFAAMMSKADDLRKQGLRATLKGLTKTEASIDKAEKGHRKADITEAKAANVLSRDTSLTKKLAAARNKFMSEHKDSKKPARSNHKTTSNRTNANIRQKTMPRKPGVHTVTAANQTVNMELAQSGSAFSVATLSQLANRKPRIEQTGPNEVTISLH